MLDMFDGAYIKKSYIKSLLLFYLLRESFCTENKNNKIFQKLLINILIFCICTMNVQINLLFLTEKK